MAMQPLPFNARSDGATPNQRLALDNLIRRELKVGDPNDPQQVARALLDRYQGDQRALGLAQESAGLPFLQMVSSAPPLPMLSTPTNVDLDQALSDVNQDLENLTHNHLVKDAQPELQGWAQAIRSAIAEGTQAARGGLDTRQRDKAFSIRRQLGDYARMARLVGSVTPAVTYDYRNLAQSLDEMSAVILVMMGEAIANTGIAGGRYMLQAPFSELQVRRDAVIYALRNLVGATQEAYEPNEWPRGLDAYRRLFDALEAQGQGDLRSLLVETELARIMDELIQRAGQGSAEGLRALGATALVDLHRFTRLVRIGNLSVRPLSPPLTGFLEALALFADAFRPAGGFRLLRAARPAILFYGLYVEGPEEKADLRLGQLLSVRGMLANQLDGLVQFEAKSTAAQTQAQIVLDTLLYGVDRAIDLYAVGHIDFGLPEARAAAYGLLSDVILGPTLLLSPALTVDQPVDEPPAKNKSWLTIPPEILKTLKALRTLLLPYNGSEDVLWDLSAKQFLGMVESNLPVVHDTHIGLASLLAQELNILSDAGSRWVELVKNMAPACLPLVGPGSVHGKILNQAIVRLNTEVALSETGPRLPDHYEVSLVEIARNTRD